MGAELVTAVLDQRTGVIELVLVPEHAAIDRERAYVHVV